MNCLTKSQWMDYVQGIHSNLILEHVASCGVCHARALIFTTPMGGPSQEGDTKEGRSMPLCGRMGEILQIFCGEGEDGEIPGLLRHLGECPTCRWYAALLRQSAAEEAVRKQEGEPLSLIATLERLFGRTLEVCIPQVMGAAPALLGDEDVLEIRLNLVDSAGKLHGTVLVNTRKGLERNALLILGNKGARAAIYRSDGKCMYQSETGSAAEQASFHLGEEQGAGPPAIIVFEERFAFSIPPVSLLAESYRGKESKRKGREAAANGL